MNPRLLSGLLLPVFLVAGVLAGVQFSRSLSIWFDEKTYPDESYPPPAPVDDVPPALAPFDAVELPSGAVGQERYRVAADELSAALELRSGRAPAVVEAGTRGSGARVIRVQTDAHRQNKEQFVIRVEGGGISIRGGSDAGNVFGMLHLADQLLAGISDEQLTAMDTAIAPALQYRFVDMGGVGIVPDSAAWHGRDYSHNSRAFAGAVRSEAPYVDEAAMAYATEQFRTYLRRMLAYGYNGVVAKGFLEYVNFDHVEDGHQVYAPESPYRERHLALRRAFGEMYDYARSLGMSVVLSTDMLALSRPLEEYFDRRFGRIDTEDPEFWDVYAAGLAELFEAFPSVDGLMIRVGEAGAVYNLAGWNYFSTLDVRTDAAVETMLRAFTDVAAVYGKTIYFRSWTVGVGEVGDLHTNPETYERVLGGLAPANLVVSTKFVAGDFYSYLPFNPTLYGGEQVRMVELQARREFEVFASFPAYLGPVHQRGLQSITRANDRVRGVWVWTQEGGPLRAGPMSLYPFRGFWELIDADVYAAARLAWDPDADVAAVTQAWIRRMFGGDPVVVSNLTELMLMSREPLLKGLYVGTFARHDVRALGLEPPPMMWIFEWDIVTASSAVLSAMYYVSREDVEGSVAEGFEAVEMVREMQALAGSIDPESTLRPETIRKLQASLAYEENLLETLAWYRRAFLNYYRWIDTGDRASFMAWRVAYEQFRTAREAHLAAYADDLDFRSFSFFDADAGLAHARRSPLMSWIARILLLLTLVSLFAGSSAVQSRTGRFPGGAGLRAMWLAAVAPWRARETEAAAASDATGAGAWSLVLGALTWLTFSSFLSPAFILLAAVLVAAALVPHLVLNRDQPAAAVRASFTAPMLIFSAIFLAVLSVRGPGYFWYHVWTSEVFRIGLITATAVATGWAWVVIYVTQRSLERAVPAAAGRVLTVTGLPLLVLGGLAASIGLEVSLTALNNELVLLPLGLSEILGITTHLNIPLSVPFYVAGTGAVLLAAGILLEAADVMRRRRRSRRLAIS